MKIVLFSGAQLCAATMLAVSVSAYRGEQPKVVSALAVAQSAPGCPAWGNPGGNPGVTFVGLMSPEEAVARSSAQITDAWYDQNGLVEEDFLAERLARAIEADKNGDGLVCVAQGWGENLNAHSHWALIWADTLDPPQSEMFFINDNHVGTSRRD